MWITISRGAVRCGCAFLSQSNGGSVLLVPHDKPMHGSSRFYEPIVKKNQEHLLEAPAIVLANLCVSCIMTSLVGDPRGGGAR